MKPFKEGVDFVDEIPKTEDTTVGIKIIRGEYSDTIYQYGKVKFEEESDGAIYLRFVYNVLESPLGKEELEKSSQFKDYIGDILVNIISANLDKGLIDEAGTDYSEEPDSQ